MRERLEEMLRKHTRIVFANRDRPSLQAAGEEELLRETIAALASGSEPDDVRETLRELRCPHCLRSQLVEEVEDEAGSRQTAILRLTDGSFVVDGIIHAPGCGAMHGGDCICAAPSSTPAPSEPARIVRNESSPKSKAIWENVDRVAEGAAHLFPPKPVAWFVEARSLGGRWVHQYTTTDEPTLAGTDWRAVPLYRHAPASEPSERLREDVRRFLENANLENPTGLSGIVHCSVCGENLGTCAESDCIVGPLRARLSTPTPEPEEAT